jgi:2,5-diketo-D-gluconate reductase B
MQMPKLGLGTWPLRGKECTEAVLSALEIGYRHIDTAKMYGNEAEVGAALAQSAVPRTDIHVTTKVWPDDLAPAAMRRSLETSLAALRVDAVDLFLIHWPRAEMNFSEAIGTLVKLKDAGLAREIGVSNFNTALLRRAVEDEGAPIACNQLEYHALLDQSKLLAYAQAQGIMVTAYAPLARGELAKHAAMQGIARKHGTTVEQVALKWLLDQDGVAAIPKASRPANQRGNFEAQKLVLDDADRTAIAALPKDVRIVRPGWAMQWD